MMRHKGGIHPTMLTVAIFLLVFCGIASSQSCEEGWKEGTGSFTSSCYIFINSRGNYDHGRSRCIIEGGSLVKISNSEEDTFLNTNFETQPFWIGLTDQQSEGNFLWEEDGESLSTTGYSNWESTISTVNRNGHDCVIFSSGKWRLVEDFCSEAKHPFVCKKDKSAIAGEIVSGPTTGTTDNTAIIILVVIIVLVIVAVILILVVLLILWKFCNDTFNTYICPCLNRGLRNKLHSLEQENQRLRHELNQAKLREPRTLNLAAKDGPDIPFASHPSSPVASPMGSPRGSLFPGGIAQPPPLQRALPSSKVSPTPGGMGMGRQTSVPAIFTRQGSNSQQPRLSLPSPPNAAARFTVQTKQQTVKEEEEEDDNDEGQNGRPADSPA